LDENGILLKGLETNSKYFYKMIQGKGVQRVSPFNADPKVKRMWRAF